MITVIIPTMWMVDRLHRTLTELNECECVKEIILLDNTSNDKVINMKKLVHILEGKNTYVNPAWNKGVKLAKCNKLLILNDDTWFDWGDIKTIQEYITPSNGMLGVGVHNYKLEKTTTINLEPINKRPAGFACAFFIHKDNWAPIPGELRIWGGDDYLFHDLKQQGKQNYKLVNFKVNGRVSATVSELRKIESLRSMMDKETTIVQCKK